MGLDFSHGGAHWAYSGFMRFRSKLAGEIGMTLENMQGFGGNTSWDKFKDDIIPLLYHSDCEGKLTISECKQIAPRLRELVKNWSDNDFDKQRALELTDGMDDAVKKKEVFLFC